MPHALTRDERFAGTGHRIGDLVDPELSVSGNRGAHAREGNGSA